MIHDYLAAKLQEASPLIIQLAQHERAIQQATATPARRQAEDAANQRRQELYELKEPSAIYQYLRTTGSADADDFRTTWQRRESSINCMERLDRNIQDFWQNVFKTPAIDINVLPAFSFVLRFEFSLAQPFLSKDEQDFYIIDNPVRKDKVFRLPYIAPSSWKGCLKAALWQLGYNDDTEAIRRLFGNKKGTEVPEEFHAGRLHFFPTFFTQKSLEIINPHDRQRRVGKDPIPIESVPIDTEGCFTLLYVPFDRIAHDSHETRRQLAQDLRLLVEGLPGMFLIYGFGAKTSSGFGTAKEKLASGFQFSHNWEEPIALTTSDAEPGVGFQELRDYLEQVSAEVQRQAEQQEQVHAERPPHGQ